ncbi:hypothetical protein N8544_03515 [Akkermansiaceae bacterium]|nr:hypothetical protein [Akkermansiaceae bacterium]
MKAETILSLHLKKLIQSKRADKVVVATTKEEGVNQILDICRSLNVKYHQGNLDNVLDRFYQTANVFHPDLVVRVTSDCPLIDPVLLDRVIDVAIEENVDYCSNLITESFPDGKDIEVFKFSALERAWTESQLKSDREYVTPFIRNNSTLKGGDIFTSYDIKCAKNSSSVRMTVDEPSDLQTIKAIVEVFGIDCNWEECVEFILKDKYI